MLVTGPGPALSPLAAAALLLLLASQLTASEKVNFSWKSGVSDVGLTTTFASVTVGGLVSRMTCTTTQQDVVINHNEAFAQNPGCRSGKGCRAQVFVL